MVEEDRVEKGVAGAEGGIGGGGGGSGRKKGLGGEQRKKQRKRKLHTVDIEQRTNLDNYDRRMRERVSNE